MKKKIGYVIAIMLAVVSMLGGIGIYRFNKALFEAVPNYLTYQSESKPIPFLWVADSISGYHEPQAAMVIPAHIEGFEHQFYLQFDTGSPHTYIYERQLQSLMQFGLKIKEVVKNGLRYIEHMTFKLGGNPIDISMVRILPNYGKSFTQQDTLSGMNLGTIGSDFIVDRVLTIDFKNEHIELASERSDWMVPLGPFQPFDFSGRRIMLPVKVDDKEYEFLYDSGCSAFGLITIKSRFDSYTDEYTEMVHYEANSWGSGIPITSKVSDKTFEIGGESLRLERVSYIDMYTAIQPLVTPFTRIQGWMGNQPFNQGKLIIDAKSESFIVVK